MSENEDGSLTEEQVQTPAEEVAVSGTEEVKQPEGEQKPEGEGEQEHKEQRTPWFQKRIDELTREKWEARREADAAKALAEQLRNRQPGDEPKPEPTDIDELVTRRAQELHEQKSFNEACNTTYQKGKESFQDFDEAVKGHTLLGDLGSRREYLEAINSLPNGPQVYHHLGKHLDDAAHVLSLPPVKMALELTKISGQLSKPAPVSKAPAPIKPIGGAGSHETDPSKMSMDEWIRWRDKQAEAERNR